MIDTHTDLTGAPDIETALRNPQAEYSYRDNYNKLLTEKAVASVNDVLANDPQKQNELRKLFEGEDGSTIIEGEVVKTLSEAGLLKIRAIRAGGNAEGQTGWFEKARMKEWEKDLGHEVWGVVDKYSVELPEGEASAPVTTSLSLEVKQEVLEGQKNRYGGPMWGEVNFDRWTLTRKSN